MKTLFITLGIVWISISNSISQNITIASAQKISNAAGDLGNILPSNGYFADRIRSIGDLNGDGVPDLAVSASMDGTGGFYIFFMNSDGSLKARQKVSQDSGKLNLTFANHWGFGKSIAPIGDLDGDGVIDLAVSAFAGGNATGAVYILFMNKNGTVKSTTTIDATNSLLSSYLTGGDGFGIDLACIGDINGDGVPDLAVGASLEDSKKGAVYILELKSDGTLKAVSRIASGVGNLSSTVLNAGDDFGSSITNIGDLDGDGIVDVVAGAQGDNASIGAAYIIFLKSDGTVKSFNKINSSGTDNIETNSTSYFGVSLGLLGDIDGDGVNDIIVGSSGDNDNGPQRGAAYIVFLTKTGHVKGFQKLSDKTAGISGKLSDAELFGSGVTGIDGKSIAIGARGDNDGASESGALFVMQLHGTAGIETTSLFNANVSVYPNPSIEGFKVDFNIPIGGMVNISLSDITGKSIKSMVNSFQSSGTYQYTIDVNHDNLKQGVYLLKFYYNEQTLYKKIVIE